MTHNVTEDTSGPVKRVPCEVYSRVVGYLRPVQDWNEGKQQEFADRRVYALRESVPGGFDLEASASSSDAGGAGPGDWVAQEHACPAAES
jgi:hypothetical protein